MLSSPEQLSTSAPQKRDQYQKNVEMRKCPNCSRNIPATSHACRYCGHSLNPIEQRQSTPKTTRRTELYKNEGKDKKILNIIYVVGILISLGFFYKACYGEPNGGGRSSSNSETAASVMCEKFVRGQLKAPSTASFPSGTAKDINNQGDGQYKVSSYVDAENSFGAKIRSDYVCVVKYVGDDKWRLISLDIY